MVRVNTGGGSCAVAASAHAGCERYRHTEPMVTGTSRRRLAEQLGHPDTTAGIPEARWMRAMTFERLVRHERFVSQLVTTAVGALGFARPVGVRRADGGSQPATTAAVLRQADLAARHERLATMITSLAVPFVDMERVPGATPVKPDFAIVVPDLAVDAPDGARATKTVLIMGDAKDYERVRSRIDDARMLKGFLQVAMGAVSAEAWSEIPAGMSVHDWGALAVPRNAFLQPTAVVEDLHDHRLEVLDRVRERDAVIASGVGVPRSSESAEGGDAAAVSDDLVDFVAHQEMSFDPGTCRSCPLFGHCRTEIRASADPVWRLVELGIGVASRPGLLPMVTGGQPIASSAPSDVARVRATLTGGAQWTDQRRIDPVGEPGTINVVLAKSDAATLGVYGIGIQVVGGHGPGPWDFAAFPDAQAPATRLEVMARLGAALSEALGQSTGIGADSDTAPVHVVIPDSVTGDLLVSIADSLAGVEISRLRWARDVEQGRPALTYDGEPADIPDALTQEQRLAVSFLLDDDRSRALRLRTALLDVRRVLARHLVTGGPSADALRLDYLVRWATSTSPLDHRVVSDEIADSRHTPGARLSNQSSDAIHRASTVGRGSRTSGARGSARSAESGDTAYRELVVAELTYKADQLTAAAGVLAGVPDSILRQVHRALEGDAQRVWRRRWALHASDLVRFGRVPWWWRNTQVDQIDADGACDAKLLALGNPHEARARAVDAGTRQVALATVVQTAPLRIDVRSRRLGVGAVVHLAHSELGPSIEFPTTELKVQKGSFKFKGQPVGRLVADQRTEQDGSLRFDPGTSLALTPGSEVILIDGTWLTTFKAPDVAVERPALDATSAPKVDCLPGDFDDDPDAHRYCCRPHEQAEGEMADWLAERRERGELNPEAWPPVVDTDAFDVVAVGTPTGGASGPSVDPVPADLTIDDLD